MILLRWYLIALILCCNTPLLAADSPWTMEAIMALKTISDPQYQLRRLQGSLCDSQRQLPAQGIRLAVSGLSRLRCGRLARSLLMFSDARPRWSRNGNRLAFVSRRDGRSQVYVVATPDGEPKKFDRFSNRRRRFQMVSGRQPHLLWLSRSCAFPGRQKKSPGRRRSDCCKSRVTDIAGSSSSQSMVVRRQQLTTSDRHVTSFDWAPDGKKVVYSGQVTPRNRDTFHVDLYELDLLTRREATLVTQEGRDAEPSYSPDGRGIAFHSQAGKINYFEERHVGLVSSGGGEIRYLTRNLAADVFRGGNEFWWTKDGSELIFGAGSGTQDHLFTVRLKDGTASRSIEALAGPSSFSISSNGQQMAFLKSSPSTPSQLYAATKTGGEWKERKLISANPEVDLLPRVTAKTLRWKSKDGLEVEGVLRLPFGYKQGKRVPLLVELHGGPTGVALEGFPVSRTYPYQLFMQEGFAVLAPNFRGSSNYGGKFRLANIESQGFGDFDDVMTGI